MGAWWTGSMVRGGWRIWASELRGLLHLVFG